MNRQELVDAIAEKADLSKTAAGKAVDVALEAITEALKRGEDARIVGFGTFTVSERAASEGRNPRTGETIQIAATKRAKWKPGKRLKEEIQKPSVRRLTASERTAMERATREADKRTTAALDERDRAGPPSVRAQERKRA